MPKPPEHSVSGDACDRFRGKCVRRDLDILQSVRPGYTSNRPQTAHLNNFKRLYLL